MHLRVLGGVVQHVVELDLVDLGDGADVARQRLVHLDLCLSAQQEQVPGLDRLASFADIELAARGQASLMHAEHREAPYVGVDLDLEDVGEGVLLRIGLGPELARFPVRRGLDIDRRVSLQRVGKQLHDDVHQLGDARSGLRRGEHHRDEMPLAQRPLERRVQLLGRHLALLEVGLHQLLVDLDHLVDQLAVRLVHGREVGFARRSEEAVGDLAVVAGGQVERQAFLAERLLDALEQVLQVDVVGVDLVDDEQPVQAALRRPLHEASGHHLDAVLRVDDDGGGFHRGEGRQRLAEKIGVAGGVEQVDAGGFAVGLGVEARDGELQGVLQLLLERGVIAHSGAALDAAGRGDRPRSCEQRLGQRGLPRSGLADERNGPDSFD